MFKKKYSKVKHSTNENDSNSIEIIKQKENKCKCLRNKCLLLILSIIIIIISVIISGYFVYQNYKNANSSLPNNNKNVWRNPKVLDNENNPLRKTIYGKFMVFFELECIAQKNVSNRDIIDEFVNLFECYRLSQDIQDQYPNIINHWIYMEKKKSKKYYFTWQHKIYVYNSTNYKIQKFNAHNSKWVTDSWGYNVPELENYTFLTFMAGHKSIAITSNSSNSTNGL